MCNNRDSLQETPQDDLQETQQDGPPKNLPPGTKVINVSMEQCKELGLTLRVPADRIIAIIWGDLMTRKDYRHVWEATDPETRLEMIKEWRDFARKTMSQVAVHAVRAEHPKASPKVQS